MCRVLRGPHLKLQVRDARAGFPAEIQVHEAFLRDRPTLSGEEFKSLLRHELGHLDLRHTQERYAQQEVVPTIVEVKE